MDEQNEIVPNEIVPNEIVHSWYIFPEYVKVMNDYLIHFTASKKYKQRDKDSKYLLINGFSTLTHVFKIMLNKTTLSEAVENTEKAIYYYTQFIEQMDENIMYDLNVSSNNASLFVYKKTINPLFPEPKNPADIITKNVEYLLLLYRTIFDILIQADYNSLIQYKLINIAVELCCNNSDEPLFKEALTSVMLFVNHFPTQEKMCNSAVICDHIYFYIKKFKQNTLSLERLCYKKIQPEYADKLKENSSNFIKWLLNGRLN